MTVQPAPPPFTDLAEIPAIVAAARTGYRDGVVRSLDQRRAQLDRLRRLLIDGEDALLGALAADLGKSSTEAYATEIGFTLSEIDHARRHLARWAAPEKVRVPLRLRPAKARIVREPLGVIGIIGPWNYPVQLVLAPLVAALAAGNTAVLKPSELAPACSAVLAELIARHFDPAVVGVVTGGVAETTALLAERFDHLLYTGNGRVGRVVAHAAAEHLTPITLELGGKSPAVVTAGADIAVAARRIAWGKFLNAGQTCIAPDYVLVEEAVHAPLLDALQRSVGEFFGEDPAASPDYGRIVNDHHHDRLTGLLDAGGFERVVVGGGADRGTGYLAPTVLAGVSPAAAVMQEEIFGPILPVLAVAGVRQAVEFIAERPHPLALYVFGDRATAEEVIGSTTSGGAAVNATMLHLAVPDLPFGGVGPSGTGAYHGEAGFLRFSHRRSVLDRGVRPDPPVLYPPYRRWKRKLLRAVQ
ncbi:MAG: aldehyde dehydrogenase family protein [Acidimicrobiales bacterium]|nr:aldehyde dehydrogenase family protein [Acidimicrobiales bacterium]